MKSNVKFIRRTGRDPKICEWLINENKVKIFGIAEKESNKLVKLVDDIENALSNNDNLHNFVKDNYFSNIMNILSYGFQGLTKEYVYIMAKKLQNGIITRKQLFRYIFNIDMPTKYHTSTIEIFNNIVNKNNMEYRWEYLREKISNPIRYNWDVTFIKRIVGTFIWNINGVEINFLGSQYADKEMIILTLDEVKNYMMNFHTFYDLEKIHHTCTIGKLCSDVMPDLTKEYLKYYTPRITEERIVISEKELNKYIFLNYKSDRFEPNYNKLLSEVVVEEYRRQHAIFTKQNNQINFNDDIWKYYFDYKKSINSYKLDFSKVSSSHIKYELKEYFKYMVLKNSKYSDQLREDFRLIVGGINFIVSNNRSIKYSADIDMIDVKNMIMYFSNEYINQYNRNLRPKTLTIYTTKFRKYYEWLINNATNIKTKKPSINYFNKIKWNNVDNMIENTKYIPECVVEKILNYIDDLNQDYQVILLIMLNGGLHYKDVTLLTADCLEKTEDNNYILQYIPYKIYKSRVNNGLNKYHKIVIHESVANEIIDQIKRTENIRKNTGLNEIFIHKYNKVYTKIYEPSNFNRVINKLIVKYNITDENGVLWKFTSK